MRVFGRASMLKASLLMGLSGMVFVVSAAGTVSGEAPMTQKRIYLDEFRPQHELRVEEHLLTRAKFPCVNVHTHPDKLSDAEVAEMVRVMDESNIAVSVSLDGKAGPKFAEQMQRFVKKYPGRFVLFVRMDYIGDGNPDDPTTWEMHRPDFGIRMADKLTEAVKLGASGLKLLKDLGVMHKDLHGKIIAPDDARFDPVWQRAAELGVPVLWHCADPVAFFRENGVQNERWEELYRHPEPLAAAREASAGGSRCASPVDRSPQPGHRSTPPDKVHLCPHGGPAGGSGPTGRVSGEVPEHECRDLCTGVRAGATALHRSSILP